MAWELNERLTRGQLNILNEDIEIEDLAVAVSSEIWIYRWKSLAQSVRNDKRLQPNATMPAFKSIIVCY